MSEKLSGARTTPLYRLNDKGLQLKAQEFGVAFDDLARKRDASVGRFISASVNFRRTIGAEAIQADGSLSETAIDILAPEPNSHLRRLLSEHRLGERSALRKAAQLRTSPAGLAELQPLTIDELAAREIQATKTAAALARAEKEARKPRVLQWAREAAAPLAAALTAVALVSLSIASVAGAKEQESKSSVPVATSSPKPLENSSGRGRGSDNRGGSGSLATPVPASPSATKTSEPTKQETPRPTKTAEPTKQRTPEASPTPRPDDRSGQQPGGSVDDREGGRNESGDNRGRGQGGGRGVREPGETPRGEQEPEELRGRAAEGEPQETEARRQEEAEARGQEPEAGRHGGNEPGEVRGRNRLTRVVEFFAKGIAIFNKKSHPVVQNPNTGKFEVEVEIDPNDPNQQVGIAFKADDNDIPATEKVIKVDGTSGSEPLKIEQPDPSKSEPAELEFELVNVENGRPIKNYLAWVDFNAVPVKSDDSGVTRAKGGVSRSRQGPNHIGIEILDRSNGRLGMATTSITGGLNRARTVHVEYRLVPDDIAQAIEVYNRMVDAMDGLSDDEKDEQRLRPYEGRTEFNVEMAEAPMSHARSNNQSARAGSAR